MVYTQPRIHPHELDAQNSLRFLDTNRSPNPSQKTRPSDSHKKNLIREVKKKLWDMKVTEIPIVICVLGTIPKGLVKRLDDLEIREQVETIQTTALLRLARILRTVLET